MKITFSFIGRQTGAIGILYNIKTSYTVKSVSEAKSLLYEDYNIVRQLKITGCSEEDFHAANLIKVRPYSERPRNRQGEYQD